MKKPAAAPPPPLLWPPSAVNAYAVPDVGRGGGLGWGAGAGGNVGGVAFMASPEPDGSAGDVVVDVADDVVVVVVRQGL
jgi:hypothetical protein